MLFRKLSPYIPAPDTAARNNLWGRMQSQSFGNHVAAAHLILRFFVEAQHAFGHVVIRNVEAVVGGAVFQLLTGNTRRGWILGAVPLKLALSAAKLLWRILESLQHLVVKWPHGLLSATVWVGLTRLAPVESLRPAAPRGLAAHGFFRTDLSEVTYRYAYVSMGRLWKTRGVVGVWNRARAVQGSPHPVQPLLGSSFYRGAIIGPAVQVIC